MNGLDFRLVFYTDVRIGDIINTTDGVSRVARIDDMSGVLQHMRTNVMGIEQAPLHITLENGVNRLFTPGETVSVARNKWKSGAAGNTERAGHH